MSKTPEICLSQTDCNTQCGALQFHPFSCKWRNFILLYGWLILHCVYTLHFLSPFIDWWAPRPVPERGCCEQCGVYCMLTRLPSGRCPGEVWQGHLVLLFQFLMNYPTAFHTATHILTEFRKLKLCVGDDCRNLTQQKLLPSSRSFWPSGFSPWEFWWQMDI
jgi:hypothetical protein